MISLDANVFHLPLTLLYAASPACQLVFSPAYGQVAGHPRSGRRYQLLIEAEGNLRPSFDMVLTCALTLALALALALEGASSLTSSAIRVWFLFIKEELKSYFLTS